MVITHVSQIGSSVIRTKTKSVVSVNAKTKTTIKNLVDTMRATGLVGMAAPQIGSSQRVFVTEIRPTATRKKHRQLDQLRIFINPRVVKLSKQQSSGYEGCGSVAHAQLFGKVNRTRSVIIRAMNEKGKVVTLAADGLLARVIQHEMDHLNGKVFLDRMVTMLSLIDREHYLEQS